MKKDTGLNCRNFLKTGAMISAAITAAPTFNNVMAGESVYSELTSDNVNLLLATVHR